MSTGWQAVMLVAAGWVFGGFAAADQRAAMAFAFNPPQPGPTMFTDALTMLDRERGEYATHLATYAANRVAGSGASTQALDEARQLLGLALHLAPRNRKALVVNYQMTRGIIPEPGETGYSAGVLARLLLSRAELLKRDGGAQNELLARFFIQLAARMDPRNDDAVYAAEIDRLDHGPLDWARVTDPRKPEPAAKPADAPAADPPRPKEPAPGAPAVTPKS